MRPVVPVRGLAWAGDPSSDMADLFRREEFRRSPSWWDRVRDRLSDVLDHLSFGWLGPVGQFVLWILLVLAAVAIVVFVHRKLRGRTWRKRTPAEDEVVPITVDTITDPDELAEARAAFEEERDYKQAILFRYREMVVALMGARLVDTRPGRTTGELRIDVAVSAPTAHPAFGEATDIFEIAWFSDHPSSAAEFGHLDRLVVDTLSLAGLTTGVTS